MMRYKPEDIEAVVRALVTAQPSALGIEVTTPVVYPSGDCVSVALNQEGDNFVVHDAGLGGMQLLAEGMRPNKELADRFRMAMERYGCSWIEGRVTRRCAENDLAVSIVLVANASRTIGDFVLETRRQSDGQFRYVVTERVREIVGDRLRENETFKGMSGRAYRIPNVVLDVAKNHAISFIIPLSSRNAVASQFRELYDLHAALPDIRNRTVYNDAGDFRADEDGWVLSQVGELIPYSDLKTRLPLDWGVIAGHG